MSWSVAGWWKHPWQISFQKKILEQYAIDHHFPNPCFYVDDGYSGANFNRPDFQRMITDMENGEIGIIIPKISAA